MAVPSERARSDWRGRLLSGAAVGCVLLGLKLAGGRPLGPPGPAGPAGSAAPFTGVAAPPLDFSVPVRIDIPDVGIDASVMSVGLAAGDVIGVPPLDQAQKAAWYALGPAPGQQGPAVIDAHVDSRETAGLRGAFYPLGEVHPGDQVEITRADGSVAIFTVDGVQLAPKSGFPTSEVYGAVAYPALRLITCGGPFDYTQHAYRDNTIVYAHLTGSRSLDGES